MSSSSFGDVSTPKSESFSDLFQLVYGELRRMAAHQFRRERPGHTLQPTALVNELFVRLSGHGPARYDSRAHFFAVAARAMRQILVEHSRRAKAQKRGGACQRVHLDDVQLIGPEGPDFLAVDEALARLERFDPRASQIVELRVFGGLTSSEIAEILGMGESTVRREWSVARAWLENELQDPL